jgi:hypothetical protein
LACAGEARRVRTPRPAHRGGHPCSRLWAMKRRIQDWARLTWAFRSQSSHSRQGNHAIRGIGQGGKGRLLGNGAVVELASQCRRDITTIFQPASLTPHSHRRPPFFSTLLQNCPFPSSPLGSFIASGLPSCQLLVGTLPRQEVFAPLPLHPQHTASDQLWTPRSLPVDTQPYRPTTAGLTRSLEVTFCEP